MFPSSHQRLCFQLPRPVRFFLHLNGAISLPLQIIVHCLDQGEASYMLFLTYHGSFMSWYHFWTNVGGLLVGDLPHEHQMLEFSGEYLKPSTLCSLSSSYI